MRFSHRCTSARIGILAALLLGGCATSDQPPSGPGAASEANLSHWLKGAPTVSYTGQLMYFHCTSDPGNFWTWSLTPAGDEDAAEIDVRACAADAAHLENQTVT